VDVSRWRRVDAEMWYWYGGAPLLREIKDGEARRVHRLGQDWLKGEHPHDFDFAGFELAPEDFEP
jgi:predicted cupin superfamily sugar epimerase